MMMPRLRTPKVFALMSALTSSALFGTSKNGVSIRQSDDLLYPKLTKMAMVVHRRRMNE